jgi:hypothetical protein
MATALDSLPTPLAAYSVMRLLFTAYTGPLFRVRRSADDTERDIYAHHGAPDITDLLAFVGAGNGFVSILYDQSGNGLHVATPTLAKQRQVVATGAPLYVPGTPNRLGSRALATSFVHSESTTGLGAAQVTIATTLYPTAVGYGNVYEGNSANPMLWIDGLGRLEFDAGIVRSPSSVVDSAAIATARYAGGTLSAWNIGNALGSGAGAETTNPLTLCARSGANGLIGYFCEYLAWSVPLSTGDRQLYEGSAAWWIDAQASLPAGHPYDATNPNPSPMTFDGPNQLIIMSSGETTLDVSDLYAAWVEWDTLNGHAYPAALRRVGGDATFDGHTTPYYLFLENGWRLRPYEGNHELRITGGTLLVEGGTLNPIVPTLGAYTVSVRSVMPVLGDIVAPVPTTGEIAAAVSAAAVEGGHSIVEVLRAVLATLAGPATGLTSAGGAVAFKSLDGAKTRVAGSINPVTGARTLDTVDLS